MTLDCHYWGSGRRHPCPSGQTDLRAGLAERVAGAGAPAAPGSPAPAPPHPLLPSFLFRGRLRTRHHLTEALGPVTPMSLTLCSFPQETP